MSDRLAPEKRHEVQMNGKAIYEWDQTLNEVKVSESFWTIEDGELHITLQKLQAEEPWQSAIQGHEIDQISQEEEKRRLLLERFQEEHKGFDFSQAQISGQAPNARTFMRDQ